MRQGIVVLSFLLILCFSAVGFLAPSTLLGAGEPASGEMLKMIPSETLFCVRINNLDATTNMLDQFLLGVSPVPVATSMLVRMQLGGILGNPTLAGVNMTGSFAIFAIAEPNQTVPDIYWLIPVTDYNPIIDANTNVSKPDGDGVSVITMAGKPFAHISKVGGYALISSDYAKTLRMAKLLSAGNTPALSTALDTAEAKQANTEPVWAYGNIQRVSKIYGPMLFSQMEQLKTTLQKGPDPNKPAPPMNPAMAIDLYSGLLKMLLNEGKSLTLAGSPKPDLLLLKASFRALPGTEMAGVLTADAAASRKNELLNYTEDGAAMNLVGRMNHTSMKKMNTKFIDLFVQSAGNDPNDANIVKMKKLCTDMVGSVGVPFVCSFSVDPNNKPPFDIKYVLAIKDANLFNKATDEIAQTWAGSVFDDLYKKMGMEVSFTVKRGVDNYKGVSIDAATFGMKFADTNSPESKMINAMYGKGFDYRWAIINGLWVCRISSDPNAVYKLIDQVKAGPPPQLCSEMQKALAILPDADNADVVATYNYPRLLKMMSAMMPVPMPQMDIPSKSNLAFAAKAQSGNMTLDIAIPKEHLAEIMMVFQMMMQQQMQQQMKQAPQGQPSQTPPAPQ
jgi:hypothetical protein